MENKVRVEACVETKTPCTKTENIEIFSESVGKKGKCQIHHGKTRYSNPDGSELTLNYDHGKLHGQSVSHSSQKTLLSEENYSHGLKQGKQKTFYENGKKKIEENFAKGLKHGEQLSWYENGELEQRSLYWEGNPTENWTYNEKTNPSLSANHPWFGQELTGKVKYCIQKGHLIQVND
jgi:antitoxin component YwqK of YwqJK toxin-antitoxin module